VLLRSNESIENVEFDMGIAAGRSNKWSAIRKARKNLKTNIPNLLTSTGGAMSDDDASAEEVKKP
jgi:hypothetical protein